MRVRFWGVRGSLPVPGANTVRYGGNTSCVEVAAEMGISPGAVRVAKSRVLRRLRDELGDLID